MARRRRRRVLLTGRGASGGAWRAVLEELYDGDVAALRDVSPNKPRSLRDFARVHAERLADLGLNELLLRKSIEAHLVVSHLPEDVVRKLVFTHVVHLARVDDAATRLLLARAAVENGWSGAELQDAMARVSACTAPLVAQ